MAEARAPWVHREPGRRPRGNPRRPLRNSIPEPPVATPQPPPAGRSHPPAPTQRAPRQGLAPRAHRDSGSTGAPPAAPSIRAGRAKPAVTGPSRQQRNPEAPPAAPRARARRAKPGGTGPPRQPGDRGRATVAPRAQAQRAQQGVTAPQPGTKEHPAPRPGGAARCHGPPRQPRKPGAPPAAPRAPGLAGAAGCDGWVGGKLRRGSGGAGGTARSAPRPGPAGEAGWYGWAGGKPRWGSGEARERHPQRPAPRARQAQPGGTGGRVGKPRGSRAQPTPQAKTTVRRPLSRMRRSACHLTARANAWHSTSRPTATNCSGVTSCPTRSTSCSMMGPSSRSAVT